MCAFCNIKNGWSSTLKSDTGRLSPASLDRSWDFTFTGPIFASGKVLKNRAPLQSFHFKIFFAMYNIPHNIPIPNHLQYNNSHKVYGSSKKNFFDVTFNYLWALYRSSKPSRQQRFLKLLKNSIKDGSMKRFMRICLRHEDDRAYEFFKFLRNTRFEIK